MTALSGRALLGMAACALGMASAGMAASPVKMDRRLEYRLSWGVGKIDAQRLYRNGEAGSGVTVAMVDTGLDSAAAPLFARLSPASTDLLKKREFGDIGAGHGRQTAALLAAARDGSGTMGVAYDATLLSIRADSDGSCLKICSMTGDTVARGIDYAVAHGARVIGLPLASAKPLRSVEPALQRAANAGVLIVAAAGNEGGSEPVWPARYAADPRFKGSIVVAGASTIGSQLARWSNRAGSTAAYYLVAPGEHVLVDCDTRYCGMVSGTSYSVSYVAGAAALLLGSHPELSGPQAAELLLAGARNGEQPLVSSGRGVLDVGQAARLADRKAS